MGKPNFVRLFFKRIINPDPRCDAEEMICLRNLYNNGKKKGVKAFFQKRRYQKLCYLYGCHLPFSAIIGEGSFFPHGLYGIFISSGAQIGQSPVIFQQVTIGSNTLSDSKGGGTPIIGDNVYIGAGAKIIGGIHVGNNVRIGANAVVTQDIPDNSTVVLEHPRVIIHNEIRDNSFTMLKDFKQNS